MWLSGNALTLHLWETGFNFWHSQGYPGEVPTLEMAPKPNYKHTASWLKKSNPSVYEPAHVQINYLHDESALKCIVLGIRKSYKIKQIIILSMNWKFKEKMTALTCKMIINNCKKNAHSSNLVYKFFTKFKSLITQLC